MSKAHYIAPQAVLPENALSVRLGTSGAKMTQLDVGKFVKLAGESQYDLCAAGDAIEGLILAVETAPSAGQIIGSIAGAGIMYVMADGIQATPGTGTIAVGDYVVCGTVVAKGTGLSLGGVGGLPKVCKATDQPGVAATAAAIKNGLFAWRVESLGTAGTGAVGTMIAMRRVNGSI